MKVGDLVRMKGDITLQQVWYIKDLKSDHRTIWIQVDDDLSIWRDSRWYEVINESR